MTLETIWDMLDWVEEETSRKFMTSSFMQAKGEKQLHWYETPKESDKWIPTYFSNRPFPLMPKKIRKGNKLPALEKFLRLDMEFADHDRTPTQEERDQVNAWAQSLDSCGTLNTKHGMHVYFMSAQPFQWLKIKPVCKLLEKQAHAFGIEMILCSASWTKCNWSQAGKFANNLLNNATTTTTQYIIPLCEQILLNNNSTRKSSQGTKKQAISHPSSRVKERDEFKMILRAYVNDGIALENIPMKYHNPADLRASFKQAGYVDWIEIVKANGGYTESKKGTPNVCGLMGGDSITRSIQRSWKWIDHLAHAIASWRMDGKDVNFIAGQVACNIEFDMLFTKVLNTWGQTDWTKKLAEFVGQLNEAYGNNIGNYTVSPVILSRALDFFESGKPVSRQSLKSYLDTVCAPKNKYHKSGASLCSCTRILGLAVKAGILNKDGAARNTNYEYIKQPRTASLQRIITLANKGTVQNSDRRTEETINKLEKRESLDRLCTFGEAVPSDDTEVVAGEEGGRNILPKDSKGILCGGNDKPLQPPRSYPSRRLVAFCIDLEEKRRHQLVSHQNRGTSKQEMVEGRKFKKTILA